MGELEVKSGLNAVLDTLAFLHSKGIAHCNIAPAAVLVTADGAWKLAGFGFAQTIAASPAAGALLRVQRASTSRIA